MVEVGGRPILWHIMKYLSRFEIRDFVIATGYKSEMIKDYFVNYELRNNDVTVSLGNRHSITVHGAHEELDWRVTLAYTGHATMTGGRLFRLQEYLEDEPFLVTYGDGLADVRIDSLVDFHKENSGIVTVTTVQPKSRFGMLDVSTDGLVQRFEEKPQLTGWVNAGYFIMNPGIFSFLDKDCTLEEQPLSRLTELGKLYAFKHFGFWQPVDTYRELTLLNHMWDEGHAPWATWDQTRK